MALSNYTELLAAIRTETNKSTTGITDAAIADAVTRCEAKMNRKLRLREMETTTTTSYNPASNSLSDRTVSLPTGYVELIHLFAKVSTADDTTYVEVPYIDPGRIADYYDRTSLYYTLRDAIEINSTVSSANTLLFHYLKKWDIATDTTNWLLTNYPDAYLYGSLMECELHTMNDERVGLWKSLFREAMRELNDLSNRGRDDAELDTSQIAMMCGERSLFNILTG